MECNRRGEIQYSTKAALISMMLKAAFELVHELTQLLNSHRHDIYPDITGS